MSPQPKKFSMDDYVDVAERIQDFMDAHPAGSLQTLSWGIKEVGGKSFVYYHAAAYRTPDDERPGHGNAWEPFPGPTPYTKDSELMNAETAAWGRAIVALGLVANRKIASRQEVRARALEPNAKGAKAEAKTAPPWQPADSAISALRTLYGASGWMGTPVGPLKDDGTPEDPHHTLRMQLAAVGADNAGPIGPCLAGLKEQQFNDVSQALSDAAEDAAKAKAGKS